MNFSCVYMYKVKRSYVVTNGNEPLTGAFLFLKLSNTCSVGTQRSSSLSRLAFLAWGDFHARSRLTRSNIPEEKWGLLVV